MKIKVVIILCFHLFWPDSAKEIIRGKVIKVIDGNTIELLAEDNSIYKINLYGVDCPETQQLFGIEAKRVLEDNVKGQAVEVVIEGKDRLGTRQAIVIPGRGADPRIQLLSKGLAWTSDKVWAGTSNTLEDLEEIRNKAQAKHVGIWSDQNPTPPWVFRRQETMLVCKSR